MTFSASVTNTSPEPVTITGLTDSIGEGDPFDVGAVGDVVLATTCGDAIGTVLAVGQSYGCEFTVLVSGNADDVVTDEIRFTVSDNEGNSVSDGAKADVTIDDVVPSVEVAKSDGDVTVAAPGDEVTYTVEVTNTSNEPVTVTALTDRIGEGEPFDVTETGDEVISTTCGDLLGSLVSAGETITCEFSVFVASDEAGTVDDLVRVTVTDDEGNEAVDEDDETTPVTAVADLIAAKTVQSNLTPGATGVYRLAATNDGPSTATGVILTDELPSGMTITSIDAGAWDCEDSTDTVVVCTLASLAAGTTASVDVTVQVPTSLVATTVTNVVEVEGNEDDPNLENNRAELDTVIPAVLQVQQPQHTQASPVAQALAVTGSNATALAMLAIALLITGGAAVGFSRRRRASELDC